MTEPRSSEPKGTAVPGTVTPERTEVATFGAGCFWKPEAHYREVPGVVDTAVGYEGGHVADPTYEQVCTGTTGHNEVVKLTYDPGQISTRQILEIFFVIHDPTTLNRQGNDAGTQYRSGIYYTTPEQKQVAEEMIAEMTKDKLFGNGATETDDLIDERAADR